MSLSSTREFHTVVVLKVGLAGTSSEHPSPSGVSTTITRRQVVELIMQSSDRRFRPSYVDKAVDMLVKLVRLARNAANRRTHVPYDIAGYVPAIQEMMKPKRVADALRQFLMKGGEGNFRLTQKEFCIIRASAT